MLDTLDEPKIAAEPTGEKVSSVKDGDTEIGAVHKETDGSFTAVHSSGKTKKGFDSVPGAMGAVRDLHKQASEPDASDVHTDAVIGATTIAKKPQGPGQIFMKKLRELLKPSVSADEYDAAVKTARAHAGGKAPRNATPASPDATPSFAEIEAMGIGYDWDQALESPCACGACPACTDDLDEPWEVGPQLEKTHEGVQYRTAGKAGEVCALCRFYDADDMSCRLVEGVIQPAMVCNLFSPALVTVSATERDVADWCATHRTASEHSESARLFIPHDFAEPPDWMPVLPRSGNYTHPKWGKVKASSERNARFVDGFRQGVYGQQLPVDVEHEGKAWGAVGYLKDLRQNSDGSVDAQVDWNDRGRLLIKQDRFKYISPEWYDEWQDPATDRVYKDVLIGAALTTRPFFKEGALRPLVASEHGLLIGEHKSLSEGGTRMPNPTPAETAENQIGAADATGGQPVQTQEPIVATESQSFAEMQAELRQARELNEKLTGRVQGLEDERTASRFREMAMGRSGEDDGRPWRGSAQEHVDELLALAKAFGEDSDLFKAHVTREREYAQTLHAHEVQMRTAGLYAEIGRTGDGSIGKAEDKIMSKAKELVTKGEAKTMAEATTIVLQREPELYSEHHQAFRDQAEGRGR